MSDTLRSSKLDIALELAAKGFYLFPLKENGKTPAVMNWRINSTRNPNTIKHWFKDDVTGWEQDPNFGIDCAKSGVYVIDKDVKEGKGGEKSFLELELQYGFPDTLTVTTPTGGEHLYYKISEALASTAEFLGPGIDTRGDGGYVVAPGSVIDEKPYAVRRNGVIAPLPQWLKDRLAGKRVKLRKKQKVDD